MFKRGAEQPKDTTAENGSLLALQKLTPNLPPIVLDLISTPPHTEAMELTVDSGNLIV